MSGIGEKSVYLETFGCQMNELDSELVMGQLRALGYRFVAAAESADVVLYNTCSVREHAEQKVWSRLGELKGRKAREPGLVVGVLGCMAERDGVDLIRRMPVVDVLCGPGELDKLPVLLDNAVRTRESLLREVAVNPTTGPERQVAGTKSASQVALQGNTSRRSATLAAAQDTLELLDLSRAVSPDGHDGSAYVRITRGCNKFCTYCVVPLTRGAEVHRPPEHIVEECRRLADAGVIEITLLGQTVNHYRFEHGAAVSVGGVVQPQKGRAWGAGEAKKWQSGQVAEWQSEAAKGADGAHLATSPLGHSATSRVTTFADLLARIHEEAPGIRRLRFVTSYPRDFGDEVLAVIRDHPRICRYLHVPAQSGSNRMLRAMNRGYTVEEYLEFLDRARAYLDQPELNRPLTVAGDIIVGFPGETEEDYQATIRLLERARYKNCFIFKYSPRPGTVAFDKLADDVPDEVKRRRNNELLAVQQRVSAEVTRAYLGRTLDVFVQGLSKAEQKRRPAAAGAKGTVGLTVRGASVEDGAPSACCEAAGVLAAEEAGPVQLTGRTDGDVIVFFDLPAGRAPDDLIGRIVPVQIRESRPLALFGDAVLG